MSGRSTRTMYDRCASQQNLKQSTDSLELILDVTKYVHCNNICKPNKQYPPNAALLVDIESGLRNLDKLTSKCDVAKHPFCGPSGCLLADDPKIAPHITPYACERGHVGENAVITTNMQMPQHPGFNIPDPNICEVQGNGYYADHNRTPRQNMNHQLPNKHMLNQQNSNKQIMDQSVINHQNMIQQNPNQQIINFQNRIQQHPNHQVIQQPMNHQIMRQHPNHQMIQQHPNYQNPLYTCNQNQNQFPLLRNQQSQVQAYPISAVY